LDGRVVGGVVARGPADVVAAADVGVADRPGRGVVDDVVFAWVEVERDGPLVFVLGLAADGREVPELHADIVMTAMQTSANRPRVRTNVYAIILADFNGCSHMGRAWVCFGEATESAYEPDCTVDDASLSRPDPTR
jgi:hypothetical protein